MLAIHHLQQKRISWLRLNCLFKALNCLVARAVVMCVCKAVQLQAKHVAAQLGT